MIEGIRVIVLPSVACWACSTISWRETLVSLGKHADDRGRALLFPPLDEKKMGAEEDKELTGAQWNLQDGAVLAPVLDRHAIYARVTVEDVLPNRWEIRPLRPLGITHSEQIGNDIEHGHNIQA